MCSRQEAASQRAEGCGGLGDLDGFSRRARVRRCCGVPAAPCRPWNSAWGPHSHLCFCLTCRVGCCSGLSSPGKGVGVRRRPLGLTALLLSAGAVPAATALFLPNLCTLRLLSLQRTGKGSWARPGSAWWGLRPQQTLGRMPGSQGSAPGAIPQKHWPG